MPKEIADALDRARELAGDAAGEEHQTFEFEGTIRVTVKIDRDELLAEWFQGRSGPEESDPSITVKNLAYSALMRASLAENLADLMDENEIEWGSSRITWDVDLG